jgi:hypothetical protein
MVVRHIALLLAASAGLCVPVASSFAKDPVPAGVVLPARQPVIQVALLLDTSNSMDGLIDQARTQLWTIVNEFARSKQAGRAPRLEVALYEYGNSGLPASEGYVRLVQGFTTDLDLLSEKLWALRTNGGNEYCGHVIRDAVRELDWSDDHGAYKTIFIAGNEPFTQGNVDYRSACSSAITRGVVVNTIHCGPDSAGRSGMWADGARLGEGQYMTIDQDRCVRGIIAPQDEEIRKLSLELNSTYVPYGAAGAGGAARQNAQDEIATAAPSAVAANAAVERAVAKAQAQYENAGWDLVDATREGKVKLGELKVDEIPAAMKDMSDKERGEYVESQRKRRSEIQEKINSLNKERASFVAKQEKEQGAETFDSAMLKVVREQLKTRQFEVSTDPK